MLPVLKVAIGGLVSGFATTVFAVSPAMAAAHTVRWYANHPCSIVPARFTPAPASPADSRGDVETAPDSYPACNYSDAISASLDNSLAGPSVVYGKPVPERSLGKGGYCLTNTEARETEVGADIKGTVGWSYDLVVEGIDCPHAVAIGKAVGAVLALEPMLLEPGLTQRGHAGSSRFGSPASSARSCPTASLCIGVGKRVSDNHPVLSVGKLASGRWQWGLARPLPSLDTVSYIVCPGLRLCFVQGIAAPNPTVPRPPPFPTGRFLPFLSRSVRRQICRDSTMSPMGWNQSAPAPLLA